MEIPAKQLTPTLAEAFAKQKLQEIKDEEAREFQLSHTKAVVEAALILSGDKSIDKDALEAAAWLHDIGYTISRENHAEHSLKILEKEGFEINEKLKDCILNHGNSGNPISEEAKILKIADKASALNPEILKIFKKYSSSKSKEEKQKDMDFIKATTDKGLELLDNL